MIEKIEMLVAENSDAFRNVISSGSEKAGVFFGIIFIIVFCLWNFWFILRPDNKERTFKQSVKEYSLSVTSITGFYVIILYSLILIAIHSPARYLIAYFALRSMYLI